MRVKRRVYRENGTKLKLMAFLLVILSLLGVCFYKMCPVIIRYAVSEAETTLLDSANDAILDILNEEGVSYEDMVKLSQNEEGQIISLETDIVKMNSLKSLMANRLSEIIAQREFYNLHIPIGSFVSSAFTSGIGPELIFKMQLTATARVNFSHEFKSAGINQVLHIVMVDMKINGSLVVAGFKDGISVSTSAMAAQTIIVGNVPEAYTNVIENENDNTAGLINDYGAVAGK